MPVWSGKKKNKTKVSKEYNRKGKKNEKISAPNIMMRLLNGIPWMVLFPKHISNKFQGAR